MEARILGPLSISDGHRTIPVNSGRQRALLAALLAKPNQPLSVEHLIEVLWGRYPPDNARVALRTYVMRLRQALGDELGGRIVTRPQGYQIRAEVHEVDLLMFQRHAMSARSAVREGDWGAAAGELQRALGLWSGEPFTEVPSASLRERELPHLEQLYQRTLELHYEAQLALGHHDDIVLELERAVESHPFRERFWAQLMTALYRSRRKGDALAAFQRIRRELIKELGSEPGLELQQLHLAILKNDETLVAPQVSEEPEVRQQAIESPAMVPRQLPAAPCHFTGRVDGLRVLNRALSQTQREDRTAASIVVIGGIGGIGKTALAVHWAHQVADLFPDGQLFLNLRGFETSDNPIEPETALRSLLNALGVPESRFPAQLEAQAALFRSVLADKRVLLILDNVRDTEQVIPLIPASSGCLTVISSRNQLTGLLVSTGAQSIRLGPLRMDETAKLIEDFVGDERVKAEPEAISTMVAMSECIPLAASILASMTLSQPSLRLADFVEMFEETLSALDRLETGDTATSMRSLLHGSYRHLTDDGRRLLRFFGLHHGNQVTTAAAATLAGMSLANTHKALTHLARNHLVENVRPGQYSMHDLVRSFAAEVVNQEELEADRRLASNRVLDYYLHNIHRAVGLLMPTRRLTPLPTLQRGVLTAHFQTVAEAGAWFEDNRSSIIAALLKAQDDGFPNHMWRIVEGLAPFLEWLGHWHDWYRVAKNTVDVTCALGDPYAEGIARLEFGSAGDLLDPTGEDAEPELVRALALFEEIGDISGQARTHHRLSVYSGRRHRKHECRHHAERAFDLHTKDDNPGGQAEARNALGWYFASFGDYDTAVSACREALTLNRESGNLAGEADVWDSLAYAYQSSGDLDAAEECYRQVIPMDEQLPRLRHRYNKAETLSRYGDLRQELGDTVGALQLWRKAQELLEELNHPLRDAVHQKIHSMLGQ
ncbi:DNA-binding transcriptional activator of the SARP family [Nonomuraea solani]|uniref:DNA-binding transcriptional activator of the SARP family n=1 Tax=Nonomuraea solani TaxID=1144553 RepID=A0A1H6BMY1_9ACTN|nr:DNA-binding transcriptional activator of the SARP family [Nonomuraea solani]